MPPPLLPASVIPQPLGAAAPLGKVVPPSVKPVSLPPRLSPVPAPTPSTNQPNLIASSTPLTPVLSTSTTQTANLLATPTAVLQTAASVSAPTLPAPASVQTPAPSLASNPTQITSQNKSPVASTSTPPANQPQGWVEQAEEWIHVVDILIHEKKKRDTTRQLLVRYEERPNPCELFFPAATFIEFNGSVAQKILEEITKARDVIASCEANIRTHTQQFAACLSSMHVSAYSVKVSAGKKAEKREREHTASSGDAMGEDEVRPVKRVRLSLAPEVTEQVEVFPPEITQDINGPSNERLKELIDQLYDHIALLKDEISENNAQVSKQVQELQDRVGLESTFCVGAAESQPAGRSGSAPPLASCLPAVAIGGVQSPAPPKISLELASDTQPAICTTVEDKVILQKTQEDTINSLRAEIAEIKATKAQEVAEWEAKIAETQAEMRELRSIIEAALTPGASTNPLAVAHTDSTSVVPEITALRELASIMPALLKIVGKSGI
ncbi:hypothetical protein RhiJN_15421 [Ceratobasidium sp. AG-Ba]|nr:hypothetical protein RhiJN_15421 [Ceratobasidium sp. AG-Ba]